MSKRSVVVDGQPWQDGWVGVDQDGLLWRLCFYQSTWGPALDAWVWEQFGQEGSTEFDSPDVKHPLTRVWPPEESTVDVEAEKPARRRSS